MILEAKNVCRDFIRKGSGSNILHAVAETDLAVRPGEVVVLTGRSGSGKTTLMNMLAGLLQPTKGTVNADGVNLYGMDDEQLSRFRNRHFGYIPQGASALYSLSVLDNVLLPCRLYKENASDRTGHKAGAARAKELPEAGARDDVARAEALLEKMDIAHLKDAMPKELSGGEMRRMAIARAMIMRPDVLFADEPTGDLDDENTRAVFELLRDAAADGAGVLLVSHENEAASYTDRVYRMNAGVLTVL